MERRAAARVLVADDQADVREALRLLLKGEGVTVEAVIKEVQFTNPHVWLQILVKDDKGVETEWSIESGAPGMMLRNGWKPSTLKPGDKVELTMHPLRNGNPGGSLVRVKVPDGRTLGPGAPD